MICKKDSNVATTEAIVAPIQKNELGKNSFISESIMKATIVVAGIITSFMILQKVTAFTHQPILSENLTMLLIGVVMLLCCIGCIVDECIFIPCTEKKRQDTLACARNVRRLSNEELVKLFIIETCPQVKGIQLKDEGGVYLRGRYTLHLVEFGEDGAIITSQKKDYRAETEANAIMRCLVKACK